MDNREEVPWAQQEGESLLWYERFTAYKLLGPDRTLAAVWAAHKGGQGGGKGGQGQGAPQEPLKPPSHWERAAQRHQWLDRARAWDSHIAEGLRAEREEAYIEQLREHRARASELAQQALKTGLALMRAVDKSLELSLGEEGEALPLNMVPSALRAAADVAETALNSEAHTLAVDSLIRGLED